MKIRRTIIVLHRDIGYFFAALTVVYAISGIAVNHVDDWNPNYIVTHQSRELGSLEGVVPEKLGEEILARMGIDERPKAAVPMSEKEFRIFLKDRTLSVSLPGGHLVDEQIRRRPFFFHLNVLHLNHAKGLWTWYADIYALGLLILALTGIFIIPGKKGLGGRGRILLILGFVVPAVFLLLTLL